MRKCILRSALGNARIASKRRDSPEEVSFDPKQTCAMSTINLESYAYPGSFATM